MTTNLKTFEVLSLANAEALSAILNHEKVVYEVGVGPHGKVFQMDEQAYSKAWIVMQQWSASTAQLANMLKIGSQKEAAAKAREPREIRPHRVRGLASPKRLTREELVNLVSYKPVTADVRCPALEQLNVPELFAAPEILLTSWPQIMDVEQPGMNLALLCAPYQLSNQFTAVAHNLTQMLEHQSRSIDPEVGRAFDRSRVYVDWSKFDRPHDKDYDAAAKKGFNLMMFVASTPVIAGPSIFIGGARPWVRHQTAMVLRYVLCFLGQVGNHHAFELADELTVRSILSDLDAGLGKLNAARVFDNWSADPAPENVGVRIKFLLVGEMAEHIWYWDFATGELRCENADFGAVIGMLAAYPDMHAWASRKIRVGI